MTDIFIAGWTATEEAEKKCTLGRKGEEKGLEQQQAVKVWLTICSLRC
jgi:hypothetical protein